MVGSAVTGRVWVGGEGLRSKDGVALGLAGGIVGRSVSICWFALGGGVGLKDRTIGAGAGAGVAIIGRGLGVVTIAGRLKLTGGLE